MAWTAPRTWVTGETVTAALMNAHIRDNFLETSAATVTTAGDMVYADAANSMGTRLPIGAGQTHLVSTGTAPVWRAIVTDVDTGSGTTSSTGYLTMANLSDSAFAGEVAVTVTTGVRAFVSFKAQLHNSTAGAVGFLSYSVSGATTVAASDNHAIAFESSAANDLAEFGGFDLRTGLTAGSNVFTLEGRVTAGVGTVENPEIAVVAF